MITRDEYFMGRDTAYPYDFNIGIARNAGILLPRVNALLKEYEDSQYGPTKSIGVRSGWRPKEVNDVIPNAAKKSKHMTGQAIDLTDNTGTLKKWVMNNLDVCERLGLWLESPEFTPSWLHLQCVPPMSGHRVFIP